MSNIRRLNIFDKSRLKKIAGITGFNEDYFKYNLLKECASPLQGILPLQFKFMPESYVLSENGIIKGLICVSTTQGNHEQINIKRLLFENNDYLTGKKLIKFIIRHYGEKGAKNFKVVVDNKQKDLEQLFIDGCGFRCCSYENLWDISHDFNYFNSVEPLEFIAANDGHARQISELINGEIITHYQPALTRAENEFKTPLLKLFDNKYENNYVLLSNEAAIAFLTIQTNDNYNFIISLTKNNGYQLSYDQIIAFALKSIAAKRNSAFKAYLKQNKYLKFAQDYETYLHARNYSCIQTQHVLVKEFYKPIKQEFRAFVFGENKLLSN
ncbi:MAG: hypothetical protein NC390_04510 [Fusobacterium sp.]|nr:hypothetical protein [Fusobacterium sp.]